MTVATEQIWKAFIQKMRRFVSRNVSDPDDAEDIVQEIFLKLHSRIGTLRDDTRVTPWLYRIARNAIVDYYRSRRPRAPLPENLAAEKGTVEQTAEGRIADGLGEMIKYLPEKYRQAIALTEIEGITQRELAQRLGITLAGAKSRVQRGRALLRRGLMACCHFEFDRRGGLIDYVPRSRCCDECSEQKNREHDAAQNTVSINSSPAAARANRLRGR